MAFIGNENPGYFADKLIPRIIDMILDAWNVLNPKINGTDKEDKITRKLIAEINRGKARSTHPFDIQSQPEVIKKQPKTLVGRIDIRIVHLQMTDEQIATGRDIYFAFECKRLSVTYNKKRLSQAEQYVREGMMRYIKEQYAEGLDKGGMIGYVMDGKTKDAIGCVKEAIEKHKVPLALAHAEGFCISSIKPKHPQVRETRHTVRKGPFTVHHIFLPVPHKK